MPSATKTANYGLNQWQGNEYPKRQDFVDDNAAIDAQMKANADTIDTHKADTVAHMTQGQKDVLSGAAQSATLGGMAVPKSGTQLQFPAYPLSLKTPNALTFTGGVTGSFDGSSPKSLPIPTELKNPNALTVSQGYGGQTGAYDGSAALSISIPKVTLHTASPAAALADGELYGVY